MDANSIIEAGFESEYSLKSWRICHETSEFWTDPVGLVADGLDAMFLIASELLIPVTVSASIFWLDTELGIQERSVFPPRMEWNLVAQGAEHRKRLGETYIEVETIDRSAVESFLRQACAQTGAPGMVACPGAISFSTVRARLLESLPPEGLWLRLIRDVGPAVLPIERAGSAAWVTGPQDGFIMEPVAVRLSVYDTTPVLSVAAYWSPWGAPDRPGTRALEERMTRLLSSGWELFDSGQK